MSMEKPRVLVMGAGGIGGIVAAHLFESGADVTVVTHNPLITNAINRHGFHVREEKRSHVVRGMASTDLQPETGRFDFVFLATQPPQVVEAATAARPHLNENGAMVCFQNGLCEQHVAPVVGREHTIGAVVAWGATMPSAGVYDRTSGGGFVLGRLDGADDSRFAALRALLEPIGPVDITHNLRGARWSKLAINCAISSLGTIGGARLGSLMPYRFVRRLALEVMSEVVAVAKRRAVQLEKVSGTIDLEWVALTPSDLTGPGSPSLMAKHALLLAVGAKFRRLRSSMLTAIERGRAPAVDYLNGEVIRRAADLGIAVPVNQKIQDLIYAIWQRQEVPGVKLLRQLYRDTREPLRNVSTGTDRRDAESSPPPL